MAAAEDDDSHIIASVRRILGEDAAGPRHGAAAGAGAASDIFELEPSMMIEPGHNPATPHEPTPTPEGPGEAGDMSAAELAAWASEWADEEPETTASAAIRPEPAPVFEAPAPVPHEPAASASEPPPGHPAAIVADADHRVDEPIIEARAADAAGQAFGSLRETLRAQKSASAAPAPVPGIGLASHAGGPTIEEMVRQELRPLLKAWLDAELPDLVERVVRAEIARIVERDGA